MTALAVCLALVDCASTPVVPISNEVAPPPIPKKEPPIQLLPSPGKSDYIADKLNQAQEELGKIRSQSQPPIEENPP